MIAIRITHGMALFLMACFMAGHLFSGLTNVALVRQRAQLDKEFYARVDEIVKENEKLRAMLAAR